IEDTHGTRIFLPDPAFELPADMGMGFSHIVCRRRQARANRPHRLVCDHGAGGGGSFGDGTRNLPGKDGERFSGFPLGLRLADADNGHETRPPDGLRLCRDLDIAFAMVRAAFRMPNDHIGRTAVGQHLGGDIARMGAAFLRVAILAAGGYRRATKRLARSRKQGGRNADDAISRFARSFREAFPYRPQFAQPGAGPVHFPVARDQRADSRRHDSLRGLRSLRGDLFTIKKAPQSNRQQRHGTLFPEAAEEQLGNAMLDSLRKAANTWVAKLLLGLLVVSFAIWGISGQLFTGVGNDVLTAGRTSVSMLDFRLAYDRRVREISNSLGTRLTRQQAAALGVEDQVLAELAAGAALDETARRIGLGVSQDRLAQLAASDPAFRGANGRFDRNQFEYILRQIGMSPQAYLANQEKAVMRSQIVDAVAEGVTPPDLLLRNVALYRGEDRTVEYVALPRSLVEPIEPPQEDVLKSWFEERKNDYAAPEYRRIDYVQLEAEDIADPSVISDEQVKAAYEQQKARYSKPELRTIEQLTFTDKEAAAAARESLRAGTTCEGLVEREGRTLEDVSLGSLARGEIADDAIAEAAFSLAEGQVSDVVDGVFGPVLLRVSKIEPETVTPLEEVRDEIRQELALEEASRLVIDTYDAYEDARAGGATLQEAAEQLNLTVRTIEAVDSEGLGPDGTAVTNIPRVRELIQEAFQTEVGVENSPIAIGSNGFLFYEVSEVIPARERTFEEVHDKVLADWTEAEAVA